jgi:hypothetical protein
LFLWKRRGIKPAGGFFPIMSKNTPSEELQACKNQNTVVPLKKLATLTTGRTNMTLSVFLFYSLYAHAHILNPGSRRGGN